LLILDQELRKSMTLENLDSRPVVFLLFAGIKKKCQYENTTPCFAQHSLMA